MSATPSLADPRVRRSSPTSCRTRSGCVSSVRSWSASSWPHSTRRWSGRRCRDHHRPRGNNLYTWAFTAYLLTSTISGPMYGKLSDLFGRRPIFLFGDRRVHGRFAAGRVVPGDVAAGRRSAASRASAQAPCSRSRSRSSATCSPRPSAASTRACSARSSGSPPSSARPSAASSPTRSAGRGSSSSTCPIGAVVFFAVGGTCRLSPRRRRPRIDYVGAVLFAGALVPILVGLTNKRGAEWTDPAVGGLMVVGPDPGAVRVRGVAHGRADRAARAVPDPLVHDLGRRGLPGRIRLLRDGGLPAALVPGRGRLLGDRIGLSDPAAARRPDHQRRRGGPDRRPHRPLPAG